MAGIGFNTRFGSMGFALVRSAVNRPLTADDKREMRTLRGFVDIGVGRPLITFFSPGKVVLSANRSAKEFTAVYDDICVVVTSNQAEFSEEEKLYMLYYVRDLPLKDMAEEHEEEVRNGVVHLADGEQFTGDFAAKVEEDAKFFDAEEGLSSDKSSETFETSVSSVESGEVDSSGVELSVEDVLRGDTALMKAYFKGFGSAMEEPWDHIKCGSRGKVVSSDDVKLINFERFFSDENIRFLSLGFPSSSKYKGPKAYSEGIFSVKDSPASHLIRCISLFGEAYMNAIFVAVRARCGDSVAEMARGKTFHLSTRSVEQGFDRASELVKEYGDLPGSKKGKLRWHLGNLVLRDEKYALKFLGRIFPRWYGPVVSVDYAVLRTELHSALTGGTMADSKGNVLWAVGAMAEFGDALLTATLYYDCVMHMNVGMTAQFMQSLRSSKLSNVNLAHLYTKFCKSVTLTEHQRADGFEAMSAVLLLDKGFSTLFSYVSGACWNIPKLMGGVTNGRSI